MGAPRVYPSCLRLWKFRMQSGPERTKPSHSQSLANFVAKRRHSQGISAARTKFLSISFANHSHSLANSFATLNSQLFLWDLIATIRSRIFGARQNSHSHSQPYRCDRGALRSGPCESSILVASAPMPARRPCSFQKFAVAMILQLVLAKGPFCPDHPEAGLNKYALLALPADWVPPPLEAKAFPR